MNTTDQTRTIEIAGRQLTWRSVGNGPPLLLLNGYSATAMDWDPVALEALAQSFELICPDNRGVGGSPLGELTEPLTVDDMAADAEALLDALGLEATPVAGWSMGGFIAQRLATRAPARVSAMVLLATDPGGSASVPPDPEAWARLTDHSGTPRERATRLLTVVFPPQVAPLVDEQFGDIVAAARAKLTPAGLKAQEDAMEAWHAEDQPAPDGSMPVLAVHGGEDVVVPPENAEALVAHWPNCRVERFAGGGHAFIAQEPTRLAELIVSFLHEAANPSS